jgi:hypothetical protein
MLVLPESPLTPELEELKKLEVGREIETGKIFTMIPPPAPEAVDRILDVIVQRGGNALGFIVLPHQNKEGRTSNFASNVEEGVKALGNRELTALGHFSTVTDLTPDLHLPFFAGGPEDWLGTRIKELPRRRRDVMGLPSTILGWGGAAVILAPRTSASGDLVAPEKFYGTRLTGVFQKMTSLKDIPGILNGLIQSMLSTEVMDALTEQNVILIRGITYVEDEETMGLLRPQIIQGHKDEKDEGFFIDHPDSRKYKEEGTWNTHLFPSDNLCRVLEDLAEKQCMRLLPATGGTLLAYSESRFCEEMNDPEKVCLLSSLPEGWWGGFSTAVESRLWDLLQGIDQQQQQQQQHQLPHQQQQQGQQQQQQEPQLQAAEPQQQQQLGQQAAVTGSSTTATVATATSGQQQQQQQQPPRQEAVFKELGAKMRALQQQQQPGQQATVTGPAAAATLAAGATGQQQQLRPLAEGEDSSSASSMDEDTEEADGIEPVGDTMMASGAKLDERGGAGMPKSKQKKKNKGKGGGKTRSRSPKIGPRTTKSAQ